MKLVNCAASLYNNVKHVRTKLDDIRTYDRHRNETGVCRAGCVLRY
jgi:hypothetical protein